MVIVMIMLILLVAILMGIASNYFPIIDHDLIIFLLMLILFFVILIRCIVENQSLDERRKSR